jgi:hypothetical protein
LCVAQNRSATVLRNARARPYLRVRLKGPPQNESGIGAVLRLEFAHTGPARKCAGSGYWSQDSAVQVLAMPERLRRLWSAGPAVGKTSWTFRRTPTEVEAAYGGALQNHSVTAPSLFRRLAVTMQ